MVEGKAKAQYQVTLPQKRVYSSTIHLAIHRSTVLFCRRTDYLEGYIL
jgi:hypothetical protein